MMLKFLLPIMSAILLGFLAGYFLRDAVLQEFDSNGDKREPKSTYTDPTILDPAILQSRDSHSPETITTTTKTWTFDDIDSQQSVFDQLIVAYRVAADSNTEQLEEHIKRCLKSSDPFYNPHLIAIFFEKYTAIDPIQALDFVAEEPRLNEQYLVGHILTSWVRSDPQAAVEYFTGLNNQILIRSIGPRLLTDPIISRSGLVAEIEKKLGPRSNLLVQQLKARTDPPAELFEAALLQTGGQRNTQLQQILSQWASRDPEAALARVSQLQNFSERKKLTRRAIMLYAQVDPEGALAYVKNSLADDQSLEVMVLNSIAATDPENSIGLIEEFSRRTGNTTALINLLSNWAAKEPIKAIAYASTLDEGQQVKAYNSMAYNYVTSYPTEGVDWLLTLGDEHRQTKRNVLRSLVRIDSQLAEDTIRRVEDNNLRTALINSLAGFKGENSPSAALTWIEQFKEESSYQQAKTSILRNWANQDPERAADEISEELDKDELAPVLTQLASSWYRRSPDDAVDWVESLPPGKGRQRSLSAIVGLVAAKDLDNAIELAAQITNEQRQRDAKRSIGYTWYARDPDELDNIIRTLKLSEQDADQLRSARRSSR